MQYTRSSFKIKYIASTYITFETLFLDSHIYEEHKMGFNIYLIPIICERRALIPWDLNIFAVVLH